MKEYKWEEIYRIYEQRLRERLLKTVKARVIATKLNKPQRSRTIECLDRTQGKVE